MGFRFNFEDKVPKSHYMRYSLEGCSLIELLLKMYNRVSAFPSYGVDLEAVIV